MENELPEMLKKQISLIESAFKNNKNHIDRKYLKIIKKSQGREAVYEKIRFKYGKVDEKIENLCNNCSQILEGLINDLRNGRETINAITTKGELGYVMQKLSRLSTEYYSKTGKLMEEYGLIDILLERNNKTLINYNLAVLRMDKDKIMKEFDKRENSRISYGAMLIKLLFQVNKIAKYIQDIEFGTMLNNDRINAKSTRENRIHLFSNLKTHYLKKVLEEQSVMTDEELEAFRKSGVAEKEFLRLFQGEFNNLDYEKELAMVECFEQKMKSVYEKKSELTDLVMSFVLNLDFRKFTAKDVKNCGIGIDENGNLVLGANISGYVMPITVHISKSNLKAYIEQEKSVYKRTNHYGNVEVEEYKALTDLDGNVLKTNLIYRLDKNQIDTVRRLQKNDQENPILKYSVIQLSKDDAVESEIVEAEKFLDEQK